MRKGRTVNVTLANGLSRNGRRDIRCTVSIGGFVPKPHTPFQWVGQLDPETTNARLAKLRDTVRSDRRYARAIGFRYHDVNAVTLASAEPRLSGRPLAPPSPRSGDPGRAQLHQALADGPTDKRRDQVIFYKSQAVPRNLTGHFKVTLGTDVRAAVRKIDGDHHPIVGHVRPSSRYLAMSYRPSVTQ